MGTLEVLQIGPGKVVSGINQLLSIVSMSLNYDKFERIEKIAVQEEMDRRQEQREKRRQKFEVEQKKRKEEWSAKHPHQHNHRHVSSCSCGFADPDELLEMQ